MKLLYFSGSTLPSSYANAVHVMKMCRAFAGLGHHVTLYGKAGQSPDDVFTYYGVPPVFDVVRSAQSPLPGLSGLARAVHTLWNKKPADLIYGRDLWTMAAVAGGRTPIALELHEIPHTAVQRVLLRRILSASNLCALVVITQGLKADLLTFAPAFLAHKILVAADGADLPEGPIVPAPLAPIAGTNYQAGYGGSLYKGKGIELILQIAKEAPHVGFHIFGGPEAERQKWLAQSPPANIRFYGHVPHAALKPMLAACDVLMAPYMPAIHIDTGADIARWISPLKLFEYMALRKPILCSDLPVLREVMTHGRNAMMVDPAEPQAWAKTLQELQHNKSLGASLAAAAYDDLEKRYCWTIRARNILDFLRG